MSKSFAESSTPANEHARVVRHERDWAQEVDVKAAEDRAEAAEASLAKANATIERLTAEGLYISEQFSGAAGDIVKLRARIAELEVGWQPVETAPANRAILIHLPNRDYYGNDGVYAGMLVDMGTGRRWMTFGWAMGRDCEEPDAWMPMPPAALTNIEKDGTMTEITPAMIADPIKLTPAQHDLLVEIERSGAIGMNVSETYRPAQKLVALGLAYWRGGGFVETYLCITDDGFDLLLQENRDDR